MNIFQKLYIEEKEIFLHIMVWKEVFINKFLKLFNMHNLFVFSQLLFNENISNIYNKRVDINLETLIYTKAMALRLGNKEKVLK